MILSKISISVKISKNFDFGQNFRKISILSQIFDKNFDLSQNFEKFWFWSKFSEVFESNQIRFFRKVPKTFYIGQNFQKKNLSTLVKFSKKCRFWWKFRITFDFGEIFEKFRFVREVGKISILVKFSKSSNLVKIVVISIFAFLSYFPKNFDFGQNSWKISILVKYFEKFRFFRKVRKISILVENF